MEKSDRSSRFIGNISFINKKELVIFPSPSPILLSDPIPILVLRSSLSPQSLKHLELFHHSPNWCIGDLPTFRPTNIFSFIIKFLLSKIIFRFIFYFGKLWIRSLFVHIEQIVSLPFSPYFLSFHFLLPNSPIN